MIDVDVTTQPVLFTVRGVALTFPARVDTATMIGLARTDDRQQAATLVRSLLDDDGQAAWDRLDIPAWAVTQIAGRLTEVYTGRPFVGGQGSSLSPPDHGRR